MRRFVFPVLVYILYRLLQWTWRVRVIEPPSLHEAMRERRPFALAHWHGDELVLLQVIGRYRLATIVSTSKDGELMSRVIGFYGVKSSRGSSTRGAVAALKGLMRLVRDERRNCSFAVDGPKGPLYKVKPGVFEVSRALALPIYWAGVACDRAFEFPRSWNKTFLPKPFAQVFIEWHGPLPAVSKEADPRDPELASRLEVELHAAKQQALASIAEPRGGC